EFRHVLFRSWLIGAAPAPGVGGVTEGSAVVPPAAVVVPLGGAPAGRSVACASRPMPSFSLIRSNRPMCGSSVVVVLMRPRIRAGIHRGRSAVARGNRRGLASAQADFPG